MISVSDQSKKEVLDAYRFHGTLLSMNPYGNGHINDTFLLVFDMYRMGRLKVVLQRINTDVFQKPQELMENVIGVTSFLQKKILEAGGDSSRETLTLIPTADGEFFYVDTQGGYWRAYQYITDSVCYEQVERPEYFFESARLFGIFQRQISDYPIASLHEIIPDFHNTQVRYEQFQKALKEDVCGRAQTVSNEIRDAITYASLCDIFPPLIASGELPLRVTHNDTKLNNLMFDNQTGKGLCIMDLDTVMPGLLAYDFGDAIRFGANTAAEDETDLSRVSLDLRLYEAYTKGFVEGCGSVMTERERELLPEGALVMTYECGLRFLTDYLNGDTYFKVKHPTHNLDRCRTQFALLADMTDKLPVMRSF